ncbi:MAG: hypothetical protein R2813_04550 [Flavobacteriales bacterium]
MASVPLEPLTKTSLKSAGRKCRRIVLAAFAFVAPLIGFGQFYHGMHQPFGKNRVQYEEFNWQKFEFRDFTVFFYGKGRNLAVFTARNADQTIDEVERFFDYPVRGERLQFVVYEKLEHFRQSNVGIPETDESNVGGKTQIAGNKIFVYYNGDLNDLRRQVRKGVSEVLIAQMMFGDNWREMIKNTTLLNFPEWYVDGLTWYATEPWNIDADDRLRDLVLSGRYENFNRLRGEDAEIAGRSLWYYIGETYGSKVIPNIMYMARVSRNVESGFLFVLGISLETLMEDARLYFEHRYERDVEGSQEFGEFVDVRTKKRLDYSAVKSSDDDRYMAYASNDMSKTKVWIYDRETGKRKGMLRQGHRLDRLNDLGYPIMDWNPVTEQFMVISEKKGHIWLYQIDPETGVEMKSEILRLEKVLEMSISPDGKQILFSAINGGQSDIYLYNIAARGHKQLTNDIYDDRDPTYWGNDKVIFSSNRLSDTLDLARDYLEYAPGRFYDLYSLSLGDEDAPAQKLTNTPKSNERHAQAMGSTGFLYLSDQSGIKNRYEGHLDSSILSIDTTITYRYFTHSEPLTGFSRNIRATDYNMGSNSAYDLFFYEGRYKFLRTENADSPGEMVPLISGFKEENPVDSLPKEQEESGGNDGIKLIRHKVFDEPLTGAPPTPNSSTVKPDTLRSTPKSSLDDGLIDINNYVFEEESIDEMNTSRNNDVNAPADTVKTLFQEEFVVPEQRNYTVAFAATDLTTQFDFDYATDLYQPFNGGPYIMPGMGLFLKVGMLDVFEDYQLEGGFRYSFNNTGTEYFISLEDRSKRLDKKYIIQRQALQDVNRVDSLQKTYLWQGKGIFRYPFDEVHALQFTTTGRLDRVVTQGIEYSSLNTPDRYRYYLGLKAEYIFDNTLFKSLNILNGTRSKVFAEHYRDVRDLNSSFSVVGFDARNYQRIHRDLIWANRFAGSSSFGPRKLVYYMGSVDNWIVLSNRDRFDYTTNVPRDQGYAFQTIATNMRGFIQNARNGNNFLVFNSELRWPVVRYFTNKPIKSEFLANFQIIGFADVGTAWNGPNPYSDENSFNTIKVTNGAVTVTYENQSDPIIAGTGWGLRTKVWGYFVRFDYAWGIENGVFLKAVTYLSFGLDF